MNKYYPGKVVAGLDIGTNKVAMVVGIMGEDGLVEVRAYSIQQHKAIPGGKINQDKLTEVISKVYAEVQAKLDFPVKEVNISLGGSQKFHLEVSEKSTIREKPSEAISYAEVQEIEKQTIHSFSVQKVHPILAIPQDFYFDDELETGHSDPVGFADVTKITCQIFTVGFLQQNIMQINSAVKKAGLEISGRFVDIISAGEALLSDEEKEDGVCLVDIGHTTTKMAIYRGGILRYLNFFPWGGSSITTDIEEACGLTTNFAVSLKERHGLAIPEEAIPGKTVVIPMPNKKSKAINQHTLSCIISARLLGMAEAIHLGLLESNFSGKLGYGIVLTGGTAGIANIADLFSEATGEDARVALATPRFQRKVDKLDKAVPALNFSTVLGLVLAGYSPQDKREAEHKPFEYSAPDLKAVEADSGDNSNREKPWSLKKTLGNLLKDTSNGLGEY